MNQPTQFVKRARSKPIRKEIMPPWEYALLDPLNEDHIQTSLFMFIRIAAKYGFALANDPNFYQPGIDLSKLDAKPVPALDLIFAIPNGGDRDKLTAQILKQTGVKAGVSDMFLPVAKTPIINYEGKSYRGESFHGLWLELKTEKGSPQTNQKDWQEAMRQQGYCAEIVYGYAQAVDCLMWYLS